MKEFKVADNKEYNKLLDIESDVSDINTENNVPTADSAENVSTSDVVGNKNDTVSGSSLVSLIKIIDSVVDSIKVIVYNLPDSGSLTSIAQSSDITTIDGIVDAIKLKTDNLPSDPADQSMIDAKLGVTTDFAAHQTLLGYQNSLYKHVHQQARVYPSLADGIIVTGGAGAWQLGNFVEIIPASTITSSFDIHYINFEGASATDIYELVLYKGTVGNEIEIGRIRTDRESATSGVTNVPVQIPAQDANTRISAKVASKSGGADTVTISVYYHLYN